MVPSAKALQASWLQGGPVGPVLGGGPLAVGKPKAACVAVNRSHIFSSFFGADWWALVFLLWMWAVQVRYKLELEAPLVLRRLVRRIAGDADPSEQSPFSLHKVGGCNCSLLLKLSLCISISPGDAELLGDGIWYCNEVTILVSVSALRG